MKEIDQRALDDLEGGLLLSPVGARSVATVPIGAGAASLVVERGLQSTSYIASFLVVTRGAECVFNAALWSPYR